MIGCVYKITPDGSDEFYIGSAYNFKARKRKHIQAVYDDGPKYKYKLYETIRDCGGEFNMEKLYDVEYEDGIELRMEERRCYDELKPTLNMMRPYVSDEEAKEYRRNYQAAYKLNPSNADKYEKYKITKREKWSEYYIKHKDKITKRNKELRHKYEARRNNYYKKTAGEKVICACGTACVKGALVRHQTSKKHFKLLNAKEII